LAGRRAQGIATPAIFWPASSSAARLHVNAYNAYQSIIRGGHILSDAPHE